MEELLNQPRINYDFEWDPQSGAGPVHSVEIAFTERIYGFHFDPAYLHQLERCNGGVPRQKYFVAAGTVKVIERFLCVIAHVSENTRHGGSDVGVVTAQIEDRLGEVMVPFATLFAGDYLCFDAETSDPPKIVVWDHERSRPGNPITTPVADDFTSFLSLLYAEEQEAGRESK